MKTQVLFFSISLLLCLNLNAATWTGAGDGTSYTDPNNWDILSYPNIDDAIIPAGNVATINSGETIQWYAGDIKGGGTLINDGIIAIWEIGSKLINDSTIIINNGVMTLDANLFIQTGSLVNNGILEFLDDNVHITFSSGTQHDFVNTGTILKASGTGTNYIFTSLTNSGIIDIQSGTLQLRFSGNYSTGTELLAGPMALIDFHDGVQTIDGNIIGNAVGEIRMSTSMEINAGNSYSIDIEGNGISCTDCSFNGGGEFDFTDEIHFTSSASKNIYEGTILKISDEAYLEDGSLYIQTGKLINDGIIDFTVDGSHITFSSGTQHEFENNATIVKSGGTGNNYIFSEFVNAGTIDCQVGNLRLRYQGSYQNGTNLLVSTGAELSFHDGSHTFNAGINGNSQGELNMKASMLVNYGTTVAIDIDGNGINCTNCTFNGGGEFNFTEEIHFTSSASKSINDASVLRISDEAFLDDGSLYIQTGKLINDGIIDFPVDGNHITFSSGTQHEFENNGTIIKSAGSVVNYIYAEFINSGTINAQSGNLQIRFQGDYLLGTNLISASAAELDFHDGIHTFHGNIVGNALGEINMEASMYVNNGTSVSFDIEGNGISCTDCHFYGGGEFDFTDEIHFKTSAAKQIYENSIVRFSDEAFIDDGNIYIQDGTLINDGIIDFPVDNSHISFTSGMLHEFENNGTVIKSAGSGENYVYAITTNNGLSIVNEGTLNYRVNMNSFSESASYAGDGTLRVNQLLGGAIVSGTLSPGDNGTGQLTWQSDIDTANFEIDIAGPPTTAGVDFDQAVFLGDVNVAEALELNISYTPTIGDTYTIATASMIDTVLFEGIIEACGPGGRHEFNVTWDNTKIELVHTQTLISDYDALMAIYNSSNGDNWTNKTNWGQGCPCDPLAPWYGVACNTNRRVIDLFLNTNNLSGTIDPQVGDLDFAELINFSSNPNLTGSLPSSIGQLSNLEILQIASCDITGGIPSSISSLANLKDLRLQFNSLSGTIPSGLSNLNNLEVLFLHQNGFTGAIPSSFGNMASLKRLYVYDNNLSGALPTTIGNISTLTHLRVQNNSLSAALPSELGLLSALAQFWAENNNFSSSIPWQLSNCTSLTSLRIHNNNLDGCYDTRLQHLDSQLLTTGTNNFISLGNNLEPWDNFISNGTGVCCFANLIENCLGTNCDLPDGLYQADNIVQFDGNHQVGSGGSVILNAGSSVELNSGFSTTGSAELLITTNGCTQND